MKLRYSAAEPRRSRESSRSWRLANELHRLYCALCTNDSLSWNIQLRSPQCFSTCRL